MLRLKNQLGQQNFILALVYLASVNSIDRVTKVNSLPEIDTWPYLAQPISLKRVTMRALPRTIDAVEVNTRSVMHPSVQVRKSNFQQVKRLFVPHKHFVVWK